MPPIYLTNEKKKLELKGIKYLDIFEFILLNIRFRLKGHDYLKEKEPMWGRIRISFSNIYLFICII